LTLLLTLIRNGAAIDDKRRTEAQAALIDREAKTALCCQFTFRPATFLQQRRDAHEIAGKHLRSNKQLKALNPLGKAALHGTTTEQHRDAPLDFRSETLAFLKSLVPADNPTAVSAPLEGIRAWAVAGCGILCFAPKPLQESSMIRRKFITLFRGADAWLLAAQAPPAKMLRVALVTVIALLAAPLMVEGQEPNKKVPRIGLLAWACGWRIRKFRI
jgi:hypothetical protein